MLIRQHANAATTPANRRFIQDARRKGVSVRALVRQLGVSEDTVRKWESRPPGDIRDRSSERRDLGTKFTPLMEECVAELRTRFVMRIRRPQTNGLVERFNRRLNEGLSRAERIQKNSGRNCFASHAERDAFAARLVFNYNRTRQTVLGRRAPLEVLQSLRNPMERNTSAGKD